MTEQNNSLTYFTIELIKKFQKEEISKNFNPHKHNYHSLYYIREGYAIHKTKSAELKIKSNQIIIVPADTLHQLIINGVCDGFIINFNDLFVKLYCQSLNEITDSILFVNSDFRSVFSIEEKYRDFISETVSLLLFANKNEAEYKNELCGSIIQVLLIQSFALFKNKSNVSNIQSKTTNNKIITEFKNLISNNYTTIKSVSEYSNLLGINSTYLNHISKQTTGLSAGEHIREKIILEAQKMLITEDLSAKEIAYKLGYEDHAYFSRLFKQHTGFSMLQFKINLKEKSNIQ